MLKTLTIAGFKSIHRQTIEFGRINLFVGANGTGKSNVLEAVGFLSAALSRGLDPIILDTKGVRLSLPHLFKSAFRNVDLKPHFRLEAKFEGGRYECSIRSNAKKSILEFHSEALYQGDEKVFGRGPNGVSLNRKFVSVPEYEFRPSDSSRSLWDLLGSFADIDEGFRSELEQIASYSIYSPQTAVMRGMAADSRPVEPLGLTGSGLAAAFNDVLEAQKTMSAKERAAQDKIMSLIWAPGWADQIETGHFNSSIVPSHVISEGIELYIRDLYMKTNRNLLSTFDASEGTLYLIFVVSLLLHEETPDTFGLDNVDGTLNPELVRRLTSVMVDACTNEQSTARYGYQAFMTSHHPSSLDSFDIFSKDQKIFVTKRNQKPPARGGTVLELLAAPDGVSRDDWIERVSGRKLSVFLLEDKIPGALK